MHTAFLITDGPSVKNFIHSGIISDLQKKSKKIIIFHSFNKDFENLIKSKFPKISLQKIIDFSENPALRFIRESVCYSRLLYNKKIKKNSTIITSNWKTKISFKQRFLYFFIELFGWVLSLNYRFIVFFEKVYILIIQNNSYFELAKRTLLDLNINHVISTHQRSVNQILYIETGNFLKIKTSSFIFSWDNLPKARLNFKAKEILVWSHYMKSEINSYYPEIKQNNVYVLGSPQFLVHSKYELIMEREVFFKKYGLDSKKKVICFTGCDVKTSPFDQFYLEDLLFEFSKIDFQNQPQIIFRGCPVDNSGRYDAVLEKFDSIVRVINPDWSVSGEDWSDYFPKNNDQKLFVNICYHSDIVYNLGSTLALDFSFHNNKACFINYDVRDSNKWTVKDIYNFEHFKSMSKLDTVIWINSKKEITSKILSFFSEPDKFCKDLNVWKEKISSVPLVSIKSKIVNHLTN